MSNTARKPLMWPTNLDYPVHRSWYIVTDDKGTEHVVRSYRATRACVKAVDSLGVGVRAVRPATWEEYLTLTLRGYRKPSP